MTRHEQHQPCGCLFFTEPRPLIINGVDMSHLVTTVVDIRFCAQHSDMLRLTTHDEMIEEALFARSGER